MTTNSSPSIGELVESFQSGPKRVATVTKGLPRSLIIKRPSPNEWSIQEVLAHLADNAIAASWRIRLVLAEMNPPLTAYDQNAWAWPYRHVRPQDALSTLRLLRRTTAVILQRIPEDAWQRTGNHEQRGSVTLRDLVVAQVSHVDQLLTQIVEAKRRLEPELDISYRRS